MGIGIFIIIIILIVEINKQAKTIDELKKQIKTNKNYCPNCGYNLNEKQVEEKIVKEHNEEENNIPEEQAKIEIVTKEKKLKQKKYTETEIKNSAILSVGAILVVLAAIVFLTTTWDVSQDIVKTLIITLLFFVFLATSYVADKLLKLEQTSKIFLYIAMSYLPLVFLSISLFKLLGYNLSIYGPSKYVYLAISTIILGIIYYLLMKVKKDLFFAVGSLVFQVFSVILIVLSFTYVETSVIENYCNMNAILIGLSTYILLFHILFTKNIIFYNRKVHLIFNIVMTIVMPVAILFFQSSLDFMRTKDIEYLILLAINYFNAYFLLVKETDNKDTFKSIGSAIIMFISLATASVIGDDYNVYQISVLTGVFIAYIVDYLLYKKATIDNCIVTTITIVTLYFTNLLFDSFIPSYMIMLINAMLLVYSRITNEEEQIQKIITYGFSASIYTFFIDFIIKQDINIIVLPIIYTILFVVSNLFIKNEDYKESLSNTSIPFTILGFIFLINNQPKEYFLLTITALLIVIAYYTIAFIKRKKEYAYFSYFWLIVAVYFLLELIGIGKDLILYITPISCIITCGLEYIYERKLVFNNYLNISFIVSFISLALIHDLQAILIYLVLIPLFIYHNRDKNNKDELNYIPISSINIFLAIQHDIHPGLSIVAYVIAALLLIKLYISKEENYLNMSIITLFIPIIFYEVDKYICIISLIISFLIGSLIDIKSRNIARGALYISITLFLSFIIKDLGLSDITLLKIGIWTVPLILITRTIIKESNRKVFEYIGLIILYFIAFVNYSSEADGMLFVGLLLAYTVIGYNKQWGPVFLTSLIFILINVLVLTRMFWLSIPWWCYILLVGVTLIVFAMNNEIREKEKRDSLIEKIKKKIDL